jgi:hypothetical protein
MFYLGVFAPLDGEAPHLRGRTQSFLQAIERPFVLAHTDQGELKAQQTDRQTTQRGSSQNVSSVNRLERLKELSAG